ITGAGAGGADVVRTFPGALGTFTRTDEIQAGTSFNKNVGGKWQLSATVDGSHTDAVTRTDDRADTSGITLADPYGTLPALPYAGLAVASTRTDTLTSLVTLMGRPVHGPAGDIALTVKAGFAYTWQEATSTGNTNAANNTSTRFRRGDASTGFNLAIPLTSTREHFGEALGDLTLNVSAGVDKLSDFGWLTNWSTGGNWAITKRFSLQASYINNEAAPSLANLGAAAVTTYNVSTYDFTTGQTVLATVLTGGNAALKKESRHDIKLSMNWTPPFLSKNSNFVVEYFDNHSSNVSASFPLLTAAVEDAYTDRVTRVNGTITQIDERPVTIASEHQSRIRWGINLFGNMGKVVQSRSRFGMDGPPPGGPPPGEGHGGGDGGSK
ncbi:MAG TPA: TonB-dependent receptor, partial [Novosphingobium sp.]|nr:TonB-dependent receptor [Novosphingobium sp.]